MCLTCVGTCVILGARPAAGLFVLVAPVAAVGVDVVVGEDLAGGEVGDGDAGVVGDREDAFAGVAAPMPRWCMRPARRKVIVPVGVEAVVAQAVVARGRPFGGGGLRGRAVGLAGGFALQRCGGGGVRCSGAELVELALQLGEGGRGRLARASAAGSGGSVRSCPGFAGVRVSRSSADAEDREEVLEGVAAAAEAGGVDAAVIGQRGGRSAVLINGGQECGDDVVAGDGPVGGAGEQIPGVVVEPVQDLRRRFRRRGASG